MDGYQLTAVIFQSIAAFAWPIALIVVAGMFRSKLLELMPKLQLKTGGVEASFRLEQAEAEGMALPPPPGDQAQEVPTPEEVDRFVQLARLSPRAAILEQYAALENAVQLAAIRHNEGKIPKSTLTAIRLLRNNNIIDKHTAGILDDLRNVGNSARHGIGDFFGESDAIRFKKLADQVITRIELLS